MFLLTNLHDVPLIVFLGYSSDHKGDVGALISLSIASCIIVSCHVFDKATNLVFFYLSRVLWPLGPHPLQVHLCRHPWCLCPWSCLTSSFVRPHVAMAPPSLVPYAASETIIYTCRPCLASTTTSLVDVELVTPPVNHHPMVTSAITTFESSWTGWFPLRHPHRPCLLSWCPSTMPLSILICVGMTNDILDLVLFPPSSNVVTRKWIFKHKFHVDGFLECYKACILCGFT